MFAVKFERLIPSEKKILIRIWTVFSVSIKQPVVAIFMQVAVFLLTLKYCVIHWTLYCDTQLKVILFAVAPKILQKSS